MKVLYGLIFVVFIPALLVLWAWATSWAVEFPILGSSLIGISLAAAGALLMGAGMMGLMIYGKGLPMNAFPPTQYVHRGIYRIFPHPIYLGFSLLCFGAAIWFQSPSGFWLVSPIATMGCGAIVMGYEKEDLRRRFGSQIVRSYLTLPETSDRRAHFNERLSIYVLVFLPWIVLYEAVITLGIPSDGITAYWSSEYQFPVIEWTELLYGGTYVFVLSVPLFASSARILRRFAMSGLVATGVMTLLFIGVPLVAPPRDFTPEGFWGEWLLLERQFDSAAAAFPSFHVVWSILAAHAFADSFPRSRWIWWILAILMSASCITTGMHALIDVLAGFAAGLVFSSYHRAWELIRLSAERLANSWKEWILGPVRIINHGIYTGISGMVGVLTVGTIVGPEALGSTVLMALMSLIAAGLWAQFVEGSPSLLRPYGYYGGVIGIGIGAGVAELLNGNAWSLLGAYAVAAPAIQALGRLRCLVQGCCHGRKAPPEIGIRYHHPRTRVCRLADLTGIPVHPTPVYSILWNIATGIVLARLWSLQAPPSLVAGLYLVLNGLGRFVEEAYRGEPQTPLFGRMTLYQVMAILSVAAGAVMTTAQTTVAQPALRLDIHTLASAILFGLITWFAQGVDFPRSNRRFSRLI